MRPKEHIGLGMRNLLAGLLYFALVFAAGFILGPIRIVWLIPSVGVRTAELLEMPVMIAVTLCAARWIIRRFDVPFIVSARLTIGVFALILLLTAEVGVAVTLRSMSAVEAITNRDPISGAAYFVSLGVFALMPMFVRRGARLPRRPATTGALIDRFIPEADIAESHGILIHAPSDVVFRVAETFDIQSIGIVHAIFWLRSKLFRVPPPERTWVRGLVAETMALGWGILAYRPGRELVAGAVTQPWVGNVKFRSVPAAEFATFDEPDLVKIVWTLEAEPLDAATTRFRTQTRVLATDDSARRKFHRYWFVFGLGILLIRIFSNRAIRRESERQVRSLVNPAGLRDR